MSIDAHDVYCIFREIGSIGLVIFQRNGLLLRRNPRSRELMLGDINTEFVEMLKQVRALNLRFGFISDQSGMAAGTHGKSEAAALIRILDQLLAIGGTMPDFWMAGASPRPNDTRLNARNHPRQKPEVDMILRALDRYGVDTSEAVFVGSSAAIFAASNAGVTGIHCSGWGSDRTSCAQIAIEPRRSSPHEITEVQQLRAAIEQILGVRHRTGNRCIVAQSE
ncbi:Hypothetical protein NGAL_HAMBI1146_07470 [Neorhizobium galegae bv. officinalis]|nr:Hypothetical protein NGAL_HAMBI1146_07470 [Neorhizobium galegae bv. officinalis]